MKMHEVATDLQFPEGPVAMEDGSVLVVEVAGGRITRVKADGNKQTIAQPGGGPAGLAIGPDGALYVCNIGANTVIEYNDGMVASAYSEPNPEPGRIERVDISTGKVEVLYSECDGRPLMMPDDLVFDDQGGFWFTDLGIVAHDVIRLGAIYYAKADGSKIVRVRDGVISPNGIGLSPNGKTVYFSETVTARLWGIPLAATGVAVAPEPGTPGRFIGGFPGYGMFDSLGVQADGSVCVAAFVPGGMTTISPEGEDVQYLPLPSSMVTNICWGGRHMKTAYITLSGTGKLVAVDWPTAGLKLAYNA